MSFSRSRFIVMALRHSSSTRMSESHRDELQVRLRSEIHITNLTRQLNETNRRLQQSQSAAVPQIHQNHNLCRETTAKAASQ